MTNVPVALTRQLVAIDADFALSPSEGVYYHDIFIPMPPAERRIVEILVSSSAAVRFESLVGRLGPDCTIRSLKVMVSRIRTALNAACGENPIITERGRGYRWNRNRADMVPERTMGFWVKCVPCDHSWIAAYFPAPVQDFVEIASKAFCPKCGNRQPMVAKQANGRVLEEQADG